MEKKEVYATICRALNIDGKTVKASDVIGTATTAQIRAALALLIGKFEE
jgi:hypothetical protein